MKNILVSGGCGFIGSHVVEHLLKNTDHNIVIIDKLNYASYGFKRLKEMKIMENKRVSVFTWDLTCKIPDFLLQEMGEINYIIHMAAETHVDNSIFCPVDFIHNNVMSTVTILQFARGLRKLEIFFYFSTDEVYGPALDGKMFKEDERHNPTNPYSASKSSAEMICLAYRNTYGIPLMRINVMNAFGEMQHKEKFIPKVIEKIVKGEKVDIHAYPDKKKSGTRFYIHARNIAAGVLFLIKNGKIGESYNLTGEKEVSNLEMAQFIADVIGKELKYEMVDFHSDRPGHDLRYGLDGSKMKEMGWILPLSFEESLKNTILWELSKM
jgi:dTDP-glucose 4,6-dehydratase